MGVGDGARVLVVDDDPGTRRAVTRALALHGFRAEAVEGGAAALRELGMSSPDAIILDIAMPEVDGLEVCRRLRAAGDRTPVLMLTARDTIADRVVGLETGADDYLVKPFALDELLARLRALLRRAGPGEPGVLRYEDLSLDVSAWQAARGGRVLELTRTEFLLLELFLRHPRQVLSRESISLKVWGYEVGPVSNSVEVYVSYLRRKLEEGGASRLIQTVRGVGYVLRSASPPAGA